MRAFRFRAFALIAAALAAAPASAAELGFYVGFLYGDRDKELGLDTYGAIAASIYDDLEFSPELRSFSSEDDGKSYGFLAGYRLTQHLAFEGGYMYVGKQSYRESASGFFFPDDDEPQAEDWSLSLSSRSSGFTLSALGILPISYSWEVYARAGVFIGSNTLNIWANSPAVPGPIATRFNESSTDWLAGAGIAMSLAEVYVLRAEFTRIFDAGAELFGEADADVVSIGVTVSF